MNKHVAICFILLCYAVAACGSLLETCCCHGDLAHVQGQHAPHRHFLSKGLAAAHLLSHEQEDPGGVRLTHGNCCCVSSGLGEVGQPPHSLSRQSELSNPSISSCIILAPLADSDLRAVLLGGRQLMLLGPAHSNVLTSRSVLSTVLLI